MQHFDTDDVIRRAKRFARQHLGHADSGSGDDDESDDGQDDAKRVANTQRIAALEQRRKELENTKKRQEEERRKREAEEYRQYRARMEQERQEREARRKATIERCKQNALAKRTAEESNRAVYPHRCTKCGPPERGFRTADGLKKHKSMNGCADEPQPRRAPKKAPKRVQKRRKRK